MRKLAEGLYQGDVSDLQVHRPFDLIIHVGQTNYLPPDERFIHCPMLDEGGKNDWRMIWRFVELVENLVSMEKREVLVTCDMGISRSVVFSGMVIALSRFVEMDDSVLKVVELPGLPPLPELWAEAAKEVHAWYGREW